MFGLLRRLLRQPPTISDELWRTARAALPWAAALDGERAHRLRALAAQFLHEKTITPLAGLTLDAQQRCLLAALCCLPLLQFGTNGLRGWSQVLVYPGAFRVDRRHEDADGVMHEWDDELIGEAWELGPLILSWADVMADCEDPTAGYCVAAHEMAHKLDALDGALDGTPPLSAAWQREWARDFQAAYDAFVIDVEAERDIAIDDYAADSPEEFFAVVSEYHFCDPATLREVMPQVAAHLARFYGPSPLDAEPA